MTASSSCSNPFARLLILLIVVALTKAQPTQNFFGGTDNDAYVSWANSVDYANVIFISSGLDESSTTGAALHWTISDDESSIDMGVAVRTKGWFGFGLTHNGGMMGSDVFLFEKKNPDQVVDSYVTEVRFPVTDDCQDWQLIGSTIEEDFLMVQVRRKLDTGDIHDRQILNDSDPAVPLQRLLAAWGDEDSVTTHAPGNTARGAVRWFPDETNNVDFDALMEAESDGTFTLIANNYSIKEIDTEYVHYCLTASDLKNQSVPLEDAGLGIIGFEPVLTTDRVHHYTVYVSAEENEERLCGFETLGSLYSEMAFVWGPGEPAVAMPNDVAFPLGGETGFKSFMIEYHYDNPELESGIVDNSGIIFHWTRKPREHDMGIFQLGDPFVILGGEKIGNGLTEHTFSCPSSCSSAIIEEPLFVFREYLHMHKKGVSAYTDHIRDGEIMRTAHTEYFDFNQQGVQAIIQQPYEINSGDSFELKCFFRSGDGDDDKDIEFGLSSSEEMCIGYMFYYPRRGPYVCAVESGFDDCNVVYTNQPVADERVLRRDFESESTTECSALVDDDDDDDDKSDNGANSSDESSASGLVVDALAYRLQLSVLAGIVLMMSAFY